MGELDLNKVPQEFHRHKDHPEFMNYYYDLLNRGNSMTFEYKGFECTITRDSARHFLWGMIKLNNSLNIDLDQLTVHGCISFKNGNEIGFDCSWHEDFVPAKANNPLIGCTYKSFDFVENEIKKLVDQIVEITEPNKEAKN